MSETVSSRDSRFSSEPLSVSWIHGSESAKHNTDPDLQVHWYDPHTVILRQNMAVNYEAPFLYLLFGPSRAVLLDTGATSDPAFLPLRHTVDEIMTSWLAEHPRENYELVVLHSHEHDDHIAGDAQFLGRPGTTVVGADQTSAWSFLGFTEDPSAIRTLDLGGRDLLALATPGHDAAAITLYDPWTGILFTGDTVYRGRLYIDDWTAFTETIDRLVAFSEQHPVTPGFGCHYAMPRSPRVAHPVRSTFPPHEAPLEMSVAHLVEIRAAIAQWGTVPTRYTANDFILWPDADESD